MNDGLILFGDGLDQSLPTEQKYILVRENVNQRIDEAIQDGNLDKATDLVRSLVEIAKVSGRELTRVLYKFKENWSVFGVDETFEEWADRESGLHHHTVERYIRIQSMLTNATIPSEIRSELSDRNLAELFPVANMVEQGFEPTEDEWRDILIQPDETSIRTKVREIKGQEPRANALSLSIDDSGSLWVTKDNVRKFVGSLEVTDDSPIVEQAIERITRNSGILKWL
jgi:hypothetical protein